MFDVITGRRRFVKVLGAAAGTAAVAAAGAGGVELWRRRQQEEQAKLRTVPWPYQPLDSNAVAARAYQSFKKGDCMYGAFEGLVGPVAEKLGEPYTSFPFDLFAYGGGGVNGWATVCGALNGAAAAFQLLSPHPGELVDALFSWYERASLPDMAPKDARFPLVASVAGSPLCHTSVSRWCEASGKHAFSEERVERCGVLTASVARQGAELLQAQATKRPLPVVPGGTIGCAQCHGEKGQVEDTRGKMDCQGCHFHLGGKHPAI